MSRLVCKSERVSALPQSPGSNTRLVGGVTAFCLITVVSEHESLWLIDIRAVDVLFKPFASASIRPGPGVALNRRSSTLLLLSCNNGTPSWSFRNKKSHQKRSLAHWGPKLGTRPPCSIATQPSDRLQCSEAVHIGDVKAVMGHIGATHSNTYVCCMCATSCARPLQCILLPGCHS